MIYVLLYKCILLNNFIHSGCVGEVSVGDGTGGTEFKIGNYDSFAECVEAVKEQEPTANGVTYGVLTADLQKQCYAEYGQTSHNDNTKWKNCMVALEPLTEPPTEGGVFGVMYWYILKKSFFK